MSKHPERVSMCDYVFLLLAAGQPAAPEHSHLQLSDPAIRRPHFIYEVDIL